MKTARKTALLLVGLLALAATWLIEKKSESQLKMEIDSRHAAQREFVKLQRERERLRALQLSDDEIQRLRLAVSGNARSQNPIAAQDATRSESRTTLSIGEWTSAGEWRNRGTTSPRAAVETALWASVGGDVDTLKGVLEISQATRTKAEALLARLPESSAPRYASPEDMIAMFAIKNIPVGQAQLVWFNEYGPDDATACVFLKNPNSGAGSATLVVAPSVSDEDSRKVQTPPQLPADEKTTAKFLSLHREGADWRLVVPPGAVDKIAKELASASRP
jgi:hypothetical protein